MEVRCPVRLMFDASASGPRPYGSGPEEPQSTEPKLPWLAGAGK